MQYLKSISFVQKAWKTCDHTSVSDKNQSSSLFFFKDLNKGDENVENEIDLNLNAETNELINSRIERDEIDLKNILNY